MHPQILYDMYDHRYYMICMADHRRVDAATSGEASLSLALPFDFGRRALPRKSLSSAAGGTSNMRLSIAPAT